MSIRALVRERWPKCFRFSTGKDAVDVRGDGFFLRYEKDWSVPPPHLDIAEDEQKGQQIANAILYLSGSPAVKGGETMLGVAPGLRVTHPPSPHAHLADWIYFSFNSRLRCA